MVYLVKYGELERIQPDLQNNVGQLIYLDSVEYRRRLDGNENLSFEVKRSKNLDDFQPGAIYFAYADIDLTKLLFSFKLQNRKLIFNGVEDDLSMQRYTLDCVSTDILLTRARISFTYRNVSFRNLLIRAITQYRVYIPEISGDFTYIEDVMDGNNVPVIFPIQQFANATLDDLFRSLRVQGYQVFLRPDLKVQAGQKGFAPAFNLNMDFSAVDGVPNVINRNSDTWITAVYKPNPITSLIAKGGNAEEGLYSAAHAITNKETNYDLLFDVNIEGNYIFEPFNTGVLDGFSVANSSVAGWDKRYAILNTPIKIDKWQMLEVGLEILAVKPAYFLGVGSGNMYEPNRQLSGWYLNNNQLFTIVNQQFINTNKVLKPFLDIQILNISADFQTFTLISTAGLAIGDKISIGGNGTTITLALGVITEINGLEVTIDRPAAEGTYNVNLRLFRSTAYELRTLINANGQTEYWYRDGSGEFELLGTYNITYPANQFVTAFNCYEAPSYQVDNGVWEVGGYAVDYFFLDKATLFRMYDDQNKKLIVSDQTQSESVDVDAVLNTISKNGVDVGQVQFIAPAYTKVILANQELTLSKIPLSFEEDDILREGMRVLIGSEARLIQSFFQDEKEGFIILDEPLASLPSLSTIVWINTSIPADDTNIFIEYVPNVQLELRDDALPEKLEQFGYNVASVDLTEYTSAAALAERMRLFLQAETEPLISGNLSMRLNMSDCQVDGYYATDMLPTVGSYITVTESIQGIIEQPAEIVSFSLQVHGEPGFFHLVIELGETGRLETTQAILDLRKQFGINQIEQSETNFNLPPILRDYLSVEDTDLNLSPFPAGAFLSGGYQIYPSGNGDTALVFEDTDLNLSPFPAGDFLSGGYQIYQSGSQAYTIYTVYYGDYKIVYNDNNIVYVQIT